MAAIDVDVEVGKAEAEVTWNRNYLEMDTGRHRNDSSSDLHRNHRMDVESILRLSIEVAVGNYLGKEPYGRWELENDEEEA